MNPGKRRDADMKREQINLKLQEKLSKEKEALKEKLEQEKRQKQAWKEEAIRERQRRETEKKALSKLKDEASRSHFLCTVSEPKIFYLPRKLLPELDAQISNQKKQISEKIDTNQKA
ncbi:hypothetical protein DSO57_1032797 [Entomophthora muscae]|uniref:Uncharacterized protein n=1 Tax=Entomophthora muscae TaxID=34485 RepID=A0ACC2TM44_9FUNG|nr:hypothetical protein DSO57_1032797 [Entomophthora muscae]